MVPCKYGLTAMEPRRDEKLKKTEVEDAGDRLREHPMWMRLEDTIMNALRPFVEARAAVLLALQQAQPVNST